MLFLKCCNRDVYVTVRAKKGEESMMHERLHKGDDQAESSRRTITL